MTTPAADDSWKIALECSKKIGYIPTAFSQTIRLLVTDHLTNDRELRAVSKYQVARVFRSPSFKSVLYFATQALGEDFLKLNKSVSVGDLIALFEPLDLAAFISSSLLRRRAKKIAGDALWAKILPHFRLESEIGAQVGNAIPRIGFAPGLLIASLRNASHALMSASDPGSYDRFRGSLATPKRTFDLKAEQLLWGTTSVQIASILLTTFGYRAEIGGALATAVTSTKPAAAIADAGQRDFRLAVIWSDCYIQGRTQPLEKLDAKFFPFEVDRKRAEAQVELIHKGAPGWINRDKGDLTPANAPHFFVKPEGGEEAEIPDELKDVFSIKELTSMEEEDFDDLVDQIDAEQAAAKRRDDVISNKDLQELEKNLD